MQMGFKCEIKEISEEMGERPRRRENSLSYKARGE